MQNTLPRLLGGLVLAGLLPACEGPSTPATTPASAPPAASAPTPVAPPPTPLAVPDTVDQRYYVFDKGTVGRNFIRLNMTEAALLDRVPKTWLKKTSRELEGIEYPVYELRNPAYPEAAPTILELVGDEEEGYRIWRIQLHDARYRAAQGGVGVGSTYGQARQAYGIQFVERGDMGLVAVSEAAQISWLLDASTLPNPNAPVRRPTDVPDATKIKGVLLFR